MSSNSTMGTGICPDTTSDKEVMVDSQLAANEAIFSRAPDLDVCEVRLQSGERAVEQELVAALDIQQQQQHHNISSGGHRARVSMNHNTLEVAETELDPPQDHSVGRIWCLRLGMTADAWDGWGIMHVNPAVAMSYFFIAEAGCYAMCFYQLSGIPWNGSLLSLVMFVSYSVYTVLSIALDCTIWRYGPKAVDHKFFPPIIMIASMSAMPYIFLAYLGPVHSIPFNNRLHITIVNAVGSGLCVHGLLAGKSAGDRPPKPRTHLFGAFIRATLMTLQFIDALTDMSMIATLLDEKAAGCNWFGKLNRCAAWNGLIAVFSTCASIDFMCIILVLHIGKEKAGKDKSARRRFFALEALCSSCEFGMVICTLLYLFNLKKAARQQQLEKDHSTEIVLAFVSLFTTTSVFIVRMIGVSDVLRAARDVWHRVSFAAQSRFSTTSRNLSFFRGSVAPLPENVQVEK